jgi:hypothetical protein
MPVPRKPEPASSARTSRDEAKPHLVSIPRAWLIGLAALLIVPWMVVSAIYFLPGGGAPASVATPTAAPAVVDAGPWGHLEITPILVSPPLEYVGADWGGRKVEPDQWKFPGVSREQLDAFLRKAGFTADQTSRVLARTQADPATGGLVATPDPDLVRSLPPEVRGRLYAQLAKSPLNFDQANSFRFFGDSPDAWLSGTLISPATRSVLEPLLYRDGGFLHFADVELVRDQIKDPEELRRLAKTLLRQSTMIVRLTVRDSSEVTGLAEYWGRGGRRTDLRPLLESVAAGDGPGHSIDIVHLLPAFARNHLYRYPKLTAGDLNRSLLSNCLWSALNFFAVEPEDRFLELNVALETLKRDYFIVESGFQLGDIVAFLDEDGDLFHVAVYLADDLVFSKNGTSPVSPWVIMPIDRLKDFYRSRSSSPRLIYHRHGRL